MTVETFQCPSCSAPVDYETESGDSTVTCEFCANTIVVPESLRKKQQQSFQHVHVDVSGYSYAPEIEVQSGRRRGLLGCVIFFAFAITGLMVVIPMVLTG